MIFLFFFYRKDMKMDLLTVAKEVNKLGKYATVASYNQGTLYIRTVSS